MKYSNLRIDRECVTRRFTVPPRFRDFSGEWDDDDGSYKPSPCGGFTFPQSLSRETALRKLRNCMIDSIEKEISKLQQDVQDLKALRVPKKASKL